MITPIPTAVSARAPSSARRLSLLAIVAALLAACSVAPTQPVAKTEAKPGDYPSSNPWAANCYHDFERDVLKLAGKSAVNCGLLRLDATQAQRDDAQRCTREAEAQGRAYRAGQVGIDVADTYIACDVAIRDPSGQRWRLWYDFDLSDKLSKGNSDGVVQVSRCESIAFQPGSLLTGSFFSLDGCRDAPMMVASPVAAGTR